MQQASATHKTLATRKLVNPEEIMISEATRLKMRMAKIGKTRPRHTQETKEKMRLTAIRNGNRPMHDKPHSEETKEKISLSRRGKNIGENNPMWTGGNSKYYKTGYYSLEYKQWRRKVFERDSFTCRGCLSNDTYITAHHIKSFAYYPNLRFDLSNGLTLCEECHKKTDNYKGRANKKNH